MQPQYKQQNQELSEQEKIAWLRLFRTENVGPITFYKLIECYGTASKALDALPDLARRGGRIRPLKAPPQAAIEKEIAQIHKLSGGLICACEKDYPIPLAACEDAPPVLTYKGHKGLLKRPAIGIVGARNASLNGQKFAGKLAQDLGEADQIIVSGLARGIDTAAHKGSLLTGTIAVVAGGLDRIYPSENTQLYEQICAQGLVIAESPLGTEPQARHFPKRNRIISGLSAGVAVVEATMRSGSLITARMAGEQGRDVFAVPGSPMDPRAQGPNKLIRDGAVLIQNADDILSHLNSFTRTPAQYGLMLQEAPATPFIHDENPGENETQTLRDQVLNTLSTTPVTVDELVRTCHVTIGAAQSVLLELELAGRLQRLPGGRVALLN